MANDTKPRGRKPETGETTLRFALRFSSQELRRDLARRAEAQGRSMNQLINEAIARSIGWPDEETATAA